MKSIFKFIGKMISAPFKHLKSLGFTNRLALYILLFLAFGLVGGFYLSILSIYHSYTGALMCWTVVFTPIGTACSIVLSKVVQKNIAENTSAEGDGIKYAAARANNFQQYNNNSDLGQVSPPI